MNSVRSGDEPITSAMASPDVSAVTPLPRGPINPRRQARRTKAIIGRLIRRLTSGWSRYPLAK